MTIAWVIGGGGMLGAALCRSLRNGRARLFVVPDRFCWASHSKLASQISSAVQAFASQADVDSRWEIYWAAGIGVMSSSEEALAPETEALSLLIQLIESEPRLMKVMGSVIFSSSAGAIYAGSRDEVVTEDTLPAPTTAYAREKLRQEKLVESFAARSSNTSALIARITTLYGVSKQVQKPQGLLTHIARSILTNRAVQIYVPFDTIRDYISAEDAASAMIAAARAIRGHTGAVTKIIASEQPATIAQIVSIFKRIARRGPPIATGASKLSALYPRRVQFRSLVLPECKAPIRSLTVGVAQLMEAERAAFVRGPRPSRE